MPAVLKLSFQREVRRVIMEKEVSYENVSGTIRQAWPEVQSLTAKYVDEEGDLCVFSEASFSDFLAVSAATASGNANTSGQLSLRLEFVAADAMSSGKQTSLHSEADLSSNTSTNGKPEQMKKQHMKEPWGECKEAWKAWLKGKGKGKGKECKEAWKAWLKGKGKGKGKDGKGKDGKGQDGKGKGCKGKGKGKCKRSAWDAELEGPDSKRTCMRAGDQTEAKKCAHPGCNFQCTWHPTHCCAACKSSADGTRHGHRCERIAMTAADTVFEDGWVLAMEPSAPPALVEVEMELSKAKQLEEMGFDASEVSEVLKNCGGDLSKALEALSINEP